MRFSDFSSNPLDTVLLIIRYPRAHKVEQCKDENDIFSKCTDSNFLSFNRMNLTTKTMTLSSLCSEQLKAIKRKATTENVSLAMGHIFP